MEEKFHLVSSMEDEEVVEEFYEKIEAPKFVDFTLPDHFSPDDRFWFCSRVGCDQRHEEEMDPEAIYKNFVLRVMAARSPNVRFRRAITKKPPSDSKKCPLSAPPKPSKSRLPRLALVSSSISKKLIDDKHGKLKFPATNVKPVSTPKARVKHVAAKYMTTPRRKKGSSPNLKGFRSAHNPKKLSIPLPKNKVVAKALVFNSPRKVLKKKTLEDLSTPVTKLCEGVKKLQINTQKKCVNRKQSKDCTSERKRLPLDNGSRRKPSSYMAKTREVDAQFSKSLKSKTKTDYRKHGDCQRIEVDKRGDESSDMEIEEKSRCGSLELGLMAVEPSTEGHSSFQEEGTSSSEMTGENSGQDSDIKGSSEENFTALQEPKAGEQSQQQMDNIIANDVKNQNSGLVCEHGDNNNPENVLNIQKKELNSGSDSDSKVSAEENSVAITETNVDEKEQENTYAADLENQNPRVVNNLEDSDDKENALNSDNIRNLDGNNLSKQNASMKLKVKPKQIPQKLDKFPKENCPAGTGTQILKNRKLKPTNPKPFRLRTDERGILKEATLEKKVNSLENASSTSENSQGMGNGVTENKEKESKKDESKRLKKDQVVFQKPIKSRYKTITKEAEPKSEKSSRSTKSSFLQKQLARPQREAITRVKSRGNESDEISRPKESQKQGKEVFDPTKKASVAQKLAARGKRTVTIPQEPKFHSLHKPKGCTRNKP